jgi:hypothetical protein
MENIRIAVADFNADSRLDIAVAGSVLAPPSPQIWIYLAQAQGGFAAPVKNINSDISVMAAADLDADGRADLLYGGFETGGLLGVCRGLGDGTFGTCTKFVESDQGPASTVAVGDVNNDGRPDIVWSRNSQVSYLSLHINQGSFQFNYVNLSASSAFGPTSVALGDSTRMAFSILPPIRRRSSRYWQGTGTELSHSSRCMEPPAASYG